MADNAENNDHKKRKAKQINHNTPLVITSPSDFRPGIHVAVDETGKLTGLEKIRFQEKEKKEEKTKKIDITGPLHVVHKLHVDKDLNWTGKEGAKSLVLLNKIGEGAYGEVYRAKHLPTSSIIAIKSVPIAENSKASLDITKEIDILKVCRHDNIVSLYGCVFNQDSLWILMDYCGAGSVKDFMKHWPRPFEEDEIAAIMYNVLLGLKYLHSIQFIHRDLKSANILLTETGEVKIADFGVSFQVNNTLAKTNTVVGTPLFMAPEALESSTYSEKADIWSLAITAIEMVDGVPPHYDEHMMRAMMLITKSDPPTLNNPEKASPIFNQFLARCLKKDPNERPTAAELLDDAFFNDKDLKLPLTRMMAEYKVLKLQRQREENSFDDDSSDDHMTTDETNITDTELHSDSSTLNSHSEKKSSFRVKKKSKSLEHSSTIEHDHKICSPVTVNQWTPNVDETIVAMQELYQVLKVQLRLERILVDELDYYSSMPFRQLVEEIRDLKIKAWKLEQKVAKYKGEACLTPFNPATGRRDVDMIPTAILEGKPLEPSPTTKRVRNRSKKSLK